MTLTRPDPTRAKIVELNDELRRTFRGGRVQMTTGVFELGSQLRGRALSALTTYSRFSRNDDHDHGVFIFAGFSFEWQIEYRNADGTGHSPDPSDPSKTLRVLTLHVVHDLLIGCDSAC